MKIINKEEACIKTQKIADELLDELNEEYPENAFGTSFLNMSCYPIVRLSKEEYQKMSERHDWDYISVEGERIGDIHLIFLNGMYDCSACSYTSYSTNTNIVHRVLSCVNTKYEHLFSKIAKKYEDDIEIYSYHR